MENNSNDNVKEEVINIDEADVNEPDGNMETEVAELTEIDLTNDGDNEIAVENNDKSDKHLVVDEWEDCGVESEDEEEAKKIDMSFINPEDVERAILNMPNIKQLTDDMGSLKHSRKVTACPLSILDLTDSHVVELISWDTMHDFQTSFVRDTENPDTFVGIMNMAFTTCKSAADATDHLKSWKEDIDVKMDTHSHRTMESFIDKNGVKKKWTDNVAVLKNLSSEVSEQAIRDLLPAVEDVVLNVDSRKKPPANKTTPQKSSDTTDTPAPVPSTPSTTHNLSAESLDTSVVATPAPTTPGGAAESSVATTTDTPEANKTVSVLPSAPPKGFAYLVFATEDVMKVQVEAAKHKKLELCGHKLMLLTYKSPVHAIPRTYLRLRERKAVLLYIERCTSKMEALKQLPDAKAPEKLQEKIQQSKLVVENDERSRADMGLPAPSLEDLRGMNGMPRLSSGLLHKTLTRYGILKKKEEDTPNSNSSSKKRSKESPRRWRGNNRRTQSPRRGRKSPYKRTSNNNNGRRSFGTPYHARGRSGSNRNNSQTSLLGNAALANPLAQLVMQQNLLGGGGGMGHQGGRRGGYGGSAPMDGLLGNPYKGCSDNQMIRLDETGNFRADSEARYPPLNHYNDNQRAPSNDFRRRSRSPRVDFSRGDISGSGGGGGGVGMGAGGVGGGSGDDSVNLLLNLSQMLSNKMDQKRQQMEQDKRVNYNRRYNDY